MKKEKIHQRANNTLMLGIKYVSPGCDISLPSLSGAFLLSSCDAGSRLVAALLGSETLFRRVPLKQELFKRKKERKSSSFSFLLECLWHFQNCLAFKNNHFFFSSQNTQTTLCAAWLRTILQKKKEKNPSYVRN